MKTVGTVKTQTAPDRLTDPNHDAALLRFADIRKDGRENIAKQGRLRGLI